MRIVSQSLFICYFSSYLGNQLRWAFAFQCALYHFLVLFTCIFWLTDKVVAFKQLFSDCSIHFCSFVSVQYAPFNRIWLGQNSINVMWPIKKLQCLLRHSEAISRNGLADSREKTSRVHAHSVQQNRVQTHNKYTMTIIHHSKSVSSLSVYLLKPFAAL